MKKKKREMSGERKRTIKLFCPSLSIVAPLVAWEDQRLDLGSIARAFGLDPATVKLNGHYIGRGSDLIASSVTWKSLLSFFSSRGLPTGASDADADALVVDGNLSKVGTKRAHYPADVDNGLGYAIESQSSSANMSLQPEDTNLPRNKKLKESISAHVSSCYGFSESIGWKNTHTNANASPSHIELGFSGYVDPGDKVANFGTKRKQWLEDLSPSKRIRMAGTQSGSQVLR